MAQTTNLANTKADSATSLRFSDGVQLLDTIDKLRELGIDSEIPLPQIIVVGQQSAGKSSVLEALSGIPFPTSDGLCTRFAIEVILRRTAKEKTNVTIVSQSSRSSTDAASRNSIDTFHSEVAAMYPLEVHKLPNVIAIASKYMSLGNSKDFTKDILRIEVSGPRQDHLTLVDLPGLFYYTSPGKDPNEPKMVKDLVETYMKEKRSIILAVLSAKGDYQTQEILQTLKGIDPLGSRTMGVITGVDQVERNSAKEVDFLRLAKNDTTPLALGWHVLRNPSFKERDENPNLDRFELEKSFFQNRHPWSTIDHESRGSGQLKRKLSHILMEHIGRELNGVTTTLNQRIEDCEGTLSKCGDERVTLQQKREYLTGIARKYEKLVQAALEGPYEDEFFSSTGERLRALVRQASEHFARQMRDSGHRWNIFDPKTTAEDFELSAINASKTKRIGDQRGGDLEEPCFVTKVDYLLKVNDILNQHRGRELQGTFNPLLVGILFRDQSHRWKRLAEKYSRHIAELISRFILRLTEHVIDSKRTRTLLGERLRLGLLGREMQMQSRLVELLKPYEKGCPTTYTPLLPGIIDHEDVIYESRPGCDQLACQTLMTHMQAYYGIALHTFVDNVATLGVELCLLDGLEELFSPVTVVRMTVEEVNKLGSESAEDMHHRLTTQKRLEKLRAGREVCQKFNVPEFQAISPAVVVDTVHQLTTAFDTLDVSRPTTPVRHAVQQTHTESLSLSPNSSRSTSSPKTRKSGSTRATTPDAAPEQVNVPSPLTKKSSPSLFSSRQRKKVATVQSESDSDL